MESIKTLAKSEEFRNTVITVAAFVALETAAKFALKRYIQKHL